MNYPNSSDPLMIAALLAKAKSGGGGGGSVTPEQIQQAVDNYLSENPIAPGELKVTDHIINIAQEGE